VTTVYDHHLPSTGHIVQLFGSFHFKSTPEKDSKKQKVTVTVAPISKIRPSCSRVLYLVLLCEHDKALISHIQWSLPL
jgi:hypothetical protein